MERTDDWTGERLNRSVQGAVTIEHLHRYSAALELVHGMTVLDIACGEGYGSALLASGAIKVYGVDISPEAVKGAKERYIRPNLEFMVGRADSIPLKDKSVDVVVSFETIEHHNKHEEMILEVLRVLKDNGVLIMSTPDKDITQKGGGGENPYHVKELSAGEFKVLIRRHFASARFYRQATVAGSLLVPEEESASFRCFRGGFDDIEVLPAAREFTYCICVASKGRPESIAASFYNGRDILFSDVVRLARRNSPYYKLAYPLLFVLVRIRRVAKAILGRQ